MGQLERVPGAQNWIEHLPEPIRVAGDKSIVYRAATHMVDEHGMSVGVAIASALNWAKHICDTGDVKQWKGPQQVKPTSKAECCAAIALWEQMKGLSHAASAAVPQPCSCAAATRRCSTITGSTTKCAARR